MVGAVRYQYYRSRDGVVRLKGFVESDDARRQVLEITRNTDGVTQVDDRELLVGRPASESFETASTTGAAPVATTGIAPAASDATPDASTIVSLVQAKYFLDQMIKARNISVEMSNGVMTLRGQVARVTLPGDATPLAFRRTGDALEVTLPAGARHPIGVALILSGQGVAA